LADCATTLIIFRDEKYFSNLKLTKANTISDSANLIECDEITNIILSGERNIYVKIILYSNRSRKNLFSFKDIRLNVLHIEL